MIHNSCPKSVLLRSTSKEKYKDKYIVQGQHPNGIVISLLPLVQDTAIVLEGGKSQRRGNEEQYVPLCTLVADNNLKQ